MVEQVTIAAAHRDKTGTNVARRLRRAGRMPAVLYGAGVGSRPVDVEVHDVDRALRTSAGKNVLIRLRLDGEEHLTIPRGIQRHPVRGDLLHVDFVVLDPSQRVRVEVPVQLEGVDDVEFPGVVSQIEHAIPIAVPPMEIPESFTLRVGDMTVGDVLRVADIDLPQEAELDIEPDRTVVTVTAPTTLEVEEEEAVPEALADIMEGEVPEEELEERLEAAQTEMEEGEQPPAGFEEGEQAS